MVTVYTAPTIASQSGLRRNPVRRTLVCSHSAPQSRFSSFRTPYTRKRIQTFHIIYIIASKGNTKALKSIKDYEDSIFYGVNLCKYFFLHVTYMYSNIAVARIVLLSQYLSPPMYVRNIYVCIKTE